MIEIYTDHACIGNPNRGGWAVSIVENGLGRTLHGSEEHPTNDRMEMLAVIKRLEAVPEASPVTIHSNSQYVMNTIERNWRRNTNSDLWVELDTAAHKCQVR